MNNTVIEDITDEVQVLKAPNNTPVNETSQPPPRSQEQRLVDIEVTDQIVGLNLMVSFLSLANKRGCFTLDESAKIWECVKKFQ